ncbi:MAG: hypothetical protein IJ661_00830 [Lachnospiraceae bacterium]|nr:hypothetical protein [Lachnospiraceae bacterium]
MKFKYYLRGIGIGIIFASIIFLVAYNDSKPSGLSDNEIIERAKELGMVEANDPINKLIDNKSTENTSAEKSDNITESTMTSENTTEKKNDTEASTENSTENTSEVNSANIKTDAGTNTENETIEKTTEAASTEDNNSSKFADDNKTYELSITRGMSSYPVSQELEKLGLIDDAAKFDDYLIENGYANRISVGTHKLTKGMDYHTIAELISDPLD